VRRVLALVLVIAAAAIVWFFLRTEDKPLTPAPAPVPQVQAAAAAQATEEIAAPSAPSEPARAVAPAEAAPLAKSVDDKVATASTLCELRGKFTVAGGAPARDVALSVMGWEGNSDRVRKYGEPEHWTEPTGTSNADGSFSIRFDPPRAYQFVLSAKLPGWCESSWRWGEIEPGKTVDVGTVELVRGGSIRGRIVDAKGRVLSKGWQVYAEASNGQRTEEREPTRVYGAPDAATGEFLLDGLPAGRARLSAQSRMANWIDGPIVEVRAGEESTADIQYTGPDNESRITVVTFCRPFYVFESEPGEILLTGADLEPRKAAKIENSSQSFSFENVPPGSYTVEIRDPRFQPWSKAGVQPGTSLDARLKGSAAVSLQVQDDAGQAVSHYTLDVRFDKANFGPSTFRVLEAKEEPPAGGLFDGLIPHDQTFIVQVDGYAPCEVPIPDLKPNERRAVSARVSHGERVVGRVVTGAQKTPFAGAKVVLSRAHKDEGGFFGSDRADEKETTSDAQGRFVFEGVPAADWEVRASRGPLFEARSALTVVAGTAVLEVEVALPAPAWLSGKLIGPEGASFENLRMQAMPVTKDEDEAERIRDALFFSRDEATVTVSPTGAFRIGPLPIGEVSVSLVLPELVIPHENGSSTVNGASIDLGSVALSAEGDTHKDFDVRAQFPGSIAVRVRVNGQPAASHLVLINEDSEYQPRASAVQLDAQGFGRSGPVKPGTYVFLTSPLDCAWIDKSSVRRTLKAGESIEVDIDVQLVTGKLHVLDAATSAPVANGSISLEYEGERGGSSARGRTDSKGDAQLQLPLGRFRVMAGNVSGYFPPDQSVVIDWTPAGPVPAEVKLPPSMFPK
jgi:hypothetical protein